MQQGEGAFSWGKKLPRTRVFRPGEDLVPKVGPRPLVNPGLAPGVSVGLSLRRGTVIRELRACARGQWKLCLSVEVPSINPGLAPGVSVGLSLRRGTFIRELRACARGQWKLCLSVEVPSINPGLAPGVSVGLSLRRGTFIREPRARARGQLRHSRAPRLAGDQVRVALELIGDVPRRAREIALVNRGHEVTPGPADGAGDPPIDAGCSHRFREAHEIAQPDVRSKAD